jgi:hypothetical protein
MDAAREAANGDVGAAAGVSPSGVTGAAARGDVGGAAKAAEMQAQGSGVDVSAARSAANGDVAGAASNTSAAGSVNSQTRAVGAAENQAEMAERRSVAGAEDSTVGAAERQQHQAEGKVTSAQMAADRERAEVDPSQVENAARREEGRVESRIEQAREHTTSAVSVDAPKEVDETRATLDVAEKRVERAEQMPADRVSEAESDALRQTRDVRDPVGAAERAKSSAIDQAKDDVLGDERATLNVDVNGPKGKID